MRLKIKDGEDSAALDAHEKKTLHSALSICRGLKRLCGGDELQFVKEAEIAMWKLCTAFAPLPSESTTAAAEATTSKVK